MLSILFKTIDEMRALLIPQEVQVMDLIAEGFNMKYEEQILDYFGVVLSLLTDTEKVQRVFQMENFSERIRGTVELLQEHVRVRGEMKKLQEEAQEKMAKASEEHMYRDILGLVQKKLGIDKDEKSTLKAKFLSSLDGKTVPKHIRTLIDEELERFEMTDKTSSEFHVLRTYLDWLTCLPYGITTAEQLDLSKARKILDRDHYGMREVKERIVEFIAVSKLRGTASGKILCLTGPPGVGKTSIVKSIAEALNRKYFRIALGGLEDVSELKGHRRTYIGAQPGKLISALKQCGSENPVLLIDEVDKVGRRTFQGSPENALLEILDPQQNNTFTDHYMDTQIDLSKVLFICTANFPEEISPVLRDRMECVEVQGYTADEKLEILNRFLLPTVLRDFALERFSPLFTLTAAAKEILIKDYCREAGVRSLQKLVVRMAGKIAVRVLENKTSVVDVDTLLDYVGRPPYPARLYDTTPVGVAAGLAYTTSGGSTLFLEAAKSSFGPPHSDLRVTGNLKPVMQESVQIAYSYVRKLASDMGNRFLEENCVHLHVPEGATPKDGPSAGITIATALVSLAFGTPVRADLAMTGEISLTGKVLAIGGLKEKVTAAKREGITTIVLPAANRASWSELPASLTSSLTPIFADSYLDVFRAAFPSLCLPLLHT